MFWCDLISLKQMNFISAYIEGEYEPGLYFNVNGALQFDRCMSIHLIHSILYMLNVNRRPVEM